MLRRVCDDEPRPLRELTPEVPAWLEAIISRLMAKDPARRFQTATEVAQVLGTCLAHVQQPLSVSLPVGLDDEPSQSGKWRRHLIRGSIAALVLAAVAAGAGSLGQLPPRPGELSGLTRGTSQSAPSALRTPLPVDPPGIGTDEIGQDLRDTWRLAGTLEASLHQREDVTENDPVSALAHDLAQQAQSLESEMTPHREVDRRTPSVRSTLYPDSRR